MAKSELVADELGTGTCSSSQNSPGVSKLLGKDHEFEEGGRGVIVGLHLLMYLMFIFGGGQVFVETLSL